jgi:hypothetical protein
MWELTISDGHLYSDSATCRVPRGLAAVAELLAFDDEDVVRGGALLVARLLALVVVEVFVVFDDVFPDRDAGDGVLGKRSTNGGRSSKAPGRRRAACVCGARRRRRAATWGRSDRWIDCADVRGAATRWVCARLVTPVGSGPS